MATSSSSLDKPSEKLTRDNYPLWRAQVLPTLRGAQLHGFLDGTEEKPSKTLSDDKSESSSSKPNPEYKT